MTQTTIMRLTSLKATVLNTIEDKGCIWLQCFSGPDNETASFHLHMPLETALAYASAINTCNDREAVEAAVLTGVDGGDVG